MSVPPCIFRDLSDEALCLDAQSGKTRRIDLWLCSWSTTIGAAPPWHRRLVGSGLAISPEKDCLTCPVRRSE